MGTNAADWYAALDDLVEAAERIHHRGNRLDIEAPQLDEGNAATIEVIAGDLIALGIAAAAIRRDLAAARGMIERDKARMGAR